MNSPQLSAIEATTGANPTASVIWMHGLGADGSDFEPVVPMFGQVVKQPMRFILPHAPRRPVTLNGGMTMRAWYDILGMDRTAREDEAGIRDSEALILEFIEREKERGIPSNRIIIAGFSQGGVMALHTGLRYSEPLAGIVALSCYLPLAEKLAEERQAANHEVPIFLGHGLYDMMVPVALGSETRGRLSGMGYQIGWHEYPMDHSVCPDEIQDVGRFMATQFSS